MGREVWPAFRENPLALSPNSRRSWLLFQSNQTRSMLFPWAWRRYNMSSWGLCGAAHTLTVGTISQEIPEANSRGSDLKNKTYPRFERRSQCSRHTRERQL